MKGGKFRLPEYALLIFGLVAVPPEAFADTDVLVKGSNLDTGLIVPQMVLPNGTTLDVAGTFQSLRDVRYSQEDLLFCGVKTGERLNLANRATWLSLTELMSDPARYGVLIYDPDLNRLVGYKAYIATLDVTNATLSLVLEKSGTFGVIPDDTFLRPKAFSFSQLPADAKRRRGQLISQ